MSENICKYCGGLGVHQFKNGDWCCNKSMNKCPEMRRKNSESNSTPESKLFKSKLRKGIKHSEETKLKMSLDRKGHFVSEETKRKLSDSNIGRKHTIETKIKMSELKIGRIHSEETKLKMSLVRKGRKKSLEHKLNISKGQKRFDSTNPMRGKLSLEQYKEKYPITFMIEEIKEDQETKKFYGRCYNSNCCDSKEKDGWFELSMNQLYQRIHSIERNDGTYFYFYCCDFCKKTCPNYGRSAIRLIRRDEINSGHIIELEYTDQDIWEWNQHVRNKQKEERGFNFCERCESKEKLHVHHIVPKKMVPGYAVDPTNGIILCEKCHKIEHPKGSICSYYELSKLKC